MYHLFCYTNGEWLHVYSTSGVHVAKLLARRYEWVWFAWEKQHARYNRRSAP